MFRISVNGPYSFDDNLNQSEGQRKSHNLVDHFADIVAGLVEWTNSALVRPLLKPFQGKMVEMLREAGWSEEA